MNLGGLMITMGQLEASLEHLQEVERLRDHQGVSPQIVGYSFVARSRACVLSGDVTEAARCLAEGRGILEPLGSEDIQLDLGVTEAWVCLAQGDLDLAETWCQRVLKLAQSMEAEQSQLEALCALGHVKLAQGDPEGAIPSLESCVALGERIGNKYERGLALTALAEARASCGERGEACEAPLHEAIQMFRLIDDGFDLQKALSLQERLEARS
jgi:tetratricopeptide (TPR) repeat protein